MRQKDPAVLESAAGFWGSNLFSFDGHKQGGDFRLEASALQIADDQFLQQLVPVQTADEAAGVVVVRDIGGIL